jgi:hypothetical protein
MRKCLGALFVVTGDFTGRREVYMGKIKIVSAGYTWNCTWQHDSKMELEGVSKHL